ncbi:MAG: helix-turn-helix domain-containing protein [Chloroflexi bacterium]|nr:helix-turn-helix domain-containing protein [Chloroflexota bacterium]
MSILTDPQIIISNGKPAFAVIPWDEYQELAQQYTVDNSTWIPHEIVKATMLGEVSLIRAWREYFNLTQQELAQRAGISQPALARLEKNDAKPRAATLKKLAAAMDITVAQLSD